MSIPSWKIRCKIVVTFLSFTSLFLSLSFFQSTLSLSVSLCHFVSLCLFETLSFSLTFSLREGGRECESELVRDFETEDDFLTCGCRIQEQHVL
jgi:hypothetical protein